MSNGDKIHLYDAVQTNKQLKGMIYKAGINYFRKNQTTSLRFRYAHEQKDFVIHAKNNQQWIWNNDTWKVNTFCIFNPKIKKLLKNGVMLACERNNSWQDKFYLRTDSG